MIRGYEALIILKTGGTEPEIARLAAQIEEPIRKVGGHPEVNQSMGRRKLAYRIARQSEGYYYLLRFQAPSERIVELERLLRLNGAIVRFMIITQDEALPLTPAPARPAGAAQPAATARG